MRRQAPEPSNCPLCLYAPCSFPDLSLHLLTHHPSSPPPSQCSFPHCGFYYLHSTQQLSHLLHCHLSSGSAAQWKSILAQDSDLLGKLLALTCRFLLKVKTLGGQTCDITEEKDFAVSALIEHSRAVLRLFPHRRRIRLSKRSDSTSSQVSKARLSTSISPCSSPYS